MSNAPHLVIYIDNSGAEDLEVTNVYRRLEDEEAERDGFFRIIDDSGEDYLHPQESFRPLPLPSSVERELEDVVLSRSRG